MKLYVAVTDYDWYRFLTQLPNVDEVNFWQPGGSSQFRALQPGELFLFKLHSPQNYIAGGGFFTYSSILPVSLAWEAFGEKNGAATFTEMRAKIVRYRGAASDQREDFEIGCILLQQPFFFPEREWIPVPRDFSLNIVQGKSYDLDSTTGRELFEAVQMRVKSRPGSQLQVREWEAVWGSPVLVRQRLGQGVFRVLVTDTYERRCAITGEKALPALEAAHIQPVTQQGKHRIDNGLLLRSDIHKLFDAGYVTVTPDYKFRASRKLKDDFDNGEDYFRLNGTGIWLPRDPDSRPNREFLVWHSDTVFRG
ncbi:MAG TPA: HNH endonuclease [Candidatus Acidoferrales bacterium]|nr:HNH endonuclease [Candidatus Acidoferrales bacterium]